MKMDSKNKTPKYWYQSTGRGMRNDLTIRLVTGLKQKSSIRNSINKFWFPSVALFVTPIANLLLWRWTLSTTVSFVWNITCILRCNRCYRLLPSMRALLYFWASNISATWNNIAFAIFAKIFWCCKMLPVVMMIPIVAWLLNIYQIKVT